MSFKKLKTEKTRRHRFSSWPSQSHSDTILNSKKFNLEVHSCLEEHNDDDFEHKNASIEEADADQDYYGVTDYIIDDEEYDCGE